VPDLSFHVEGVESVPFAAAPLLAFKVCITNASVEEPLHTIVLRCQLQLEATRRSYSEQEQARLLDLFGERVRWSQTLRTMLWTFTHVIVPPFTGSTVVDLPVPCTYDFTVAAAKYFYALETGDVPVTFLFSGTIFYAADDGALQVAHIPWDREATYRLPIAVWQAMMDHYYPNSAWLVLQKDRFDQLYQYKRQHGLPTWEHVVDRLLTTAEKRSRSDEL
jgi:hypothetical protein